LVDNLLVYSCFIVISTGIENITFKYIMIILFNLLRLISWFLSAFLGRQGEFLGELGGEYCSFPDHSSKHLLNHCSNIRTCENPSGHHKVLKGWERSNGLKRFLTIW
jgi:hypothetical protein